MSVVCGGVGVTLPPPAHQDGGVFWTTLAPPQPTRVAVCLGHPAPPPAHQGGGVFGPPCPPPS